MNFTGAIKNIIHELLVTKFLINNLNNLIMKFFIMIYSIHFFFYHLFIKIINLLLITLYQHASLDKSNDQIFNYHLNNKYKESSHLQNYDDELDQVKTKYDMYNTLSLKDVWLDNLKINFINTGYMKPPNYRKNNSMGKYYTTEDRTFDKRKLINYDRKTHVNNKRNLLFLLKKNGFKKKSVDLHYTRRFVSKKDRVSKSEACTKFNKNTGQNGSIDEKNKFTDNIDTDEQVKETIEGNNLLEIDTNGDIVWNLRKTGSLKNILKEEQKKEMFKLRKWSAGLTKTRHETNKDTNSKLDTIYNITNKFTTEEKFEPKTLLDINTGWTIDQKHIEKLSLTNRPLNFFEMNTKTLHAEGFSRHVDTSQKVEELIDRNHLSEDSLNNEEREYSNGTVPEMKSVNIDLHRKGNSVFSVMKEEEKVQEKESEQQEDEIETNQNKIRSAYMLAPRRYKPYKVACDKNQIELDKRGRMLDDSLIHYTKTDDEMRKYNQKRCFEPPRYPLNKAKDLGILDGQWKSENNRFFVNKLIHNSKIYKKGDQIDYMNNLNVAKQYDVNKLYNSMMSQIKTDAKEDSLKEDHQTNFVYETNQQIVEEEPQYCSEVVEGFTPKNVKPTQNLLDFTHEKDRIAKGLASIKEDKLFEQHKEGMIGQKEFEKIMFIASQKNQSFEEAILEMLTSNNKDYDIKQLQEQTHEINKQFDIEAYMNEETHLKNVWNENPIRNLSCNKSRFASEDPVPGHLRSVKDKRAQKLVTKNSSCNTSYILQKGKKRKVVNYQEGNITNSDFSDLLNVATIMMKPEEKTLNFTERNFFMQSKKIKNQIREVRKKQQINSKNLHSTQNDFYEILYARKNKTFHG